MRSYEENITGHARHRDPLRLIVGTNPSKRGDKCWRKPLGRTPAKRLCEAAGWYPPEGVVDLSAYTIELYERFRAVNLFERYHDTDEGWHPNIARMNAMLLLADRPRVVVCCGRAVAKAFTLDRQPFYKWALVGDTYIGAIPHPSQRNRIWNNPDTAREVGKFLRQAVKK